MLAQFLLKLYSLVPASSIGRNLVVLALILAFFISKHRLVLCHCSVLFVLFGDCFLFILVVCLYVMIVDRRVRSV
jgi:hypothetical protein